MIRSVAKYMMLSLLLVLTACEVKIPEEIISPERMEKLLYDYHLAQVMSSEVSEDYERKLYAEYVFDKHGVSKEEFDSSMVWYARNPKHLYAIYTSMYEDLEAEVAQLEGGKLTTEVIVDADYMKGDTVNLWRGRKVELLSATPLKNRITYSMDADTTYRRGDSICMSMDVLIFSPKEAKGTRSANAAVVVEYEDSTYNSNGLSILRSGHYDIAIARDFDREIKNVRGYIYFADSDTLALSRMLISNMAVMRIHSGEMDEEME